MARLIALFLMVFFLGCGPRSGAALPQSPTRSSPIARVAPTATVTSTDPVLEIAQGGGCQITPTGRNVTYSGQVKNISDKPLNRVRSIITYTAQDGTFIKTDSSAIDFDPLLPGQTSPFTTITTINPAITNCSVEFQQGLNGPKLEAIRAE